MHGAVIGGGPTILTHCDFVYAGAKLSSFSVPASIGNIRAAELIRLGLPFDARQAAELGFVAQVGHDPNLMSAATEAARKLATKPARGLQAGKQLMNRPFREQIKMAIEAENQEFSARVRREETRQAFGAFPEKRRLPAESLR